VGGKIGVVKVQAWGGLKGEVLKVGKDVGGLIVGGFGDVS
jgi:hypothetical protein